MQQSIAEGMEGLVVEGLRESKVRDGTRLGSGASSRESSRSKSPIGAEQQQGQVYDYGEEFPLEEDARVEFRPITVGVCAMETKV